MGSVFFRFIGVLSLISVPWAFGAGGEQGGGRDNLFVCPLTVSRLIAPSWNMASLRAPTTTADIRALLDQSLPGESDQKRDERRKQISGWTITKILGSGGSGVTYLVTQENGLEFVAKMLLKPEAGAKLIREAKIAELAGDLGVGPRSRVELFGDLPILKMEALEGEDLKATAKAWGPLPPGQREEAIRKVLLSLAAQIQKFHANGDGLVHADLKPENILVVNGEARLIDFGLSRKAGPTGSDYVNGTPGFIGPHQMDRRNSQEDDWHAYTQIVMDLFRDEVGRLSSAGLQSRNFGMGIPAQPTVVPWALQKTPPAFFKKYPDFGRALNLIRLEARVSEGSENNRTKSADLIKQSLQPTGWFKKTGFQDAYWARLLQLPPAEMYAAFFSDPGHLGEFEARAKQGKLNKDFIIGKLRDGREKFRSETKSASGMRMPFAFYEWEVSDVEAPRLLDGQSLHD